VHGITVRQLVLCYNTYKLFLFRAFKSVSLKGRANEFARCVEPHARPLLPAKIFVFAPAPQAARTLAPQNRYPRPEVGAPPFC